MSFSSSSCIYFLSKRLPMLLLKHFCFILPFQSEKLRDSADVFRELLVTSSQVRNNSPEFLNIWSACVCSDFCPVSTLYEWLCVPIAELDDPADCWLTYNDSEVTQTACLLAASVNSVHPLLANKGKRLKLSHPEVKLTLMLFEFHSLNSEPTHILKSTNSVLTVSLLCLSCAWINRKSPSHQKPGFSWQN